MEATSLDIAIEEILDSIEDSLKSAAKKNGSLEEVKEIVRGDRHKTKPKVPAVWIFSETATCEHLSSIVENWTLPVILSAIVKEDRPEAGYRKATRLAAKARSEILKERTLGLRKFVQDSQSARFEASAPWLREGSLFAANAVLNVIFRVKE